MTLEDEFGMMNVAVMPNVFEKNRQLLCSASALIVSGKLEHHQGVVGVLGMTFREMRSRVSPHLASRDFH